MSVEREQDAATPAPEVSAPPAGAVAAPLRPGSGRPRGMVLGLRLSALALGSTVGVGLGAVAVAFHRLALVVGGVPLVWGWVVSLGVLAGGLLALQPPVVAPRVGIVPARWGFSLGVVTVVVLGALRRPEGDIAILGDVPGMVLLVIVGVVLGTALGHTPRR